jgi:hypothetical protein
MSWAWWCMPVIPALGRLKWDDWEFKASLGYIVRLCLKKNIYAPYMHTCTCTMCVYMYIYIYIYTHIYASHIYVCDTHAYSRVTSGEGCSLRNALLGDFAVVWMSQGVLTQAAMMSCAVYFRETTAVCVVYHWPKHRYWAYDCVFTWRGRKWQPLWLFM